ncbi:hypothetical protein ACQKFM_29160 [Paenibacillus xylanexedens]|uniref:hypothetical protein n=1 Tax=Paenibacillus xylanexedens TaxID=528191 RepID=UPI003D00A18D
MSALNLNNFDEQPTEVQQAVAFYVGYTVNGVQATSQERQAHYAVLERVGLLEPIKSVVGT